jgi:Fe-S-cluster containining protein
MTDELRRAIVAAGQRAEVRAAVAAIYAELGEAIAQRRPLCSMSGRCCRFEAYGHRLFVTTIELGTFIHELRRMEPPAKLLEAIGRWDGTGCPFQVAKLCGVHGIRPLGCRMFFCDPGSTQWQNEQYERFHGRIRQLHDELGVPYAYMEWREALKNADVLGAWAPPR